jgi:hypothetical protein
MTYREAVSKCINTLKLNNKDEHVSRRYVLRLLQDTAQVLLSQRLLDRTIGQDMNLYTHIPCFEFEQIDTKKCQLIEFKMCNTLMKSKKPLPKLVFSRLGASIKDIVALDGNYRFTMIDKAQYQRNKKRKYSVKGETYIYLDSDLHLYIPDEEIYSVDLTVLTTRPEEVDNCSACSEGECKSYYNMELIIPDKLLETLFSQTLQFLGVHKQSPEDMNPNGIVGT